MRRFLNQRLRRERRNPNRSWRVDETYVRVAGNWVYLHRAVDSAGDTIDFMWSPNRDLVAAKQFFAVGIAPNPAPATGDQRGRPSTLCHGDLGIEALGRVGTAVPLPAIALLK